MSSLSLNLDQIIYYDSKNDDFNNFKERLSTYTNFNWFAIPIDISPLYCAAYGFQCISEHTIQCINCKKVIHIDIPNTNIDIDVKNQLIQHYQKQIKEIHLVHCKSNLKTLYFKQFPCFFNTNNIMNIILKLLIRFEKSQQDLSKINFFNEENYQVADNFILQKTVDNKLEYVTDLYQMDIKHHKSIANDLRVQLIQLKDILFYIFTGETINVSSLNNDKKKVSIITWYKIRNLFSYILAGYQLINTNQLECCYCFNKIDISQAYIPSHRHFCLWIQQDMPLLSLKYLCYSFKKIYNESNTISIPTTCQNIVSSIRSALLSYK